VIFTVVPDYNVYSTMYHVVRRSIGADPRVLQLGVDSVLVWSESKDRAGCRGIVTAAVAEQTFA
jgi:hypothetical protein